MSLTEALLRPYLTNPARPLITHYDDAAGTRVELSLATLRNWAAKTANWLVSEHAIEPGDPIAVLLPAHWQTAAILLGSWWCGAHIVPDSVGATVVFAPPGGTGTLVSLDPMGRDLGTEPSPGSTDFIADVRLHGDDFHPLTPIPGSTQALCGSTVDDVVLEANLRAKSQGITSGSRVLSTSDWTFPNGVIDGFLAVLAARASLVHVTNPDPNRLATHRTTERTTLDLR